MLSGIHTPWRSMRMSGTARRAVRGVIPFHHSVESRDGRGCCWPLAAVLFTY